MVGGTVVLYQSWINHWIHIFPSHLSSSLFSIQSLLLPHILRGISPVDSLPNNEEGSGRKEIFVLVCPWSSSTNKSRFIVPTIVLGRETRTIARLSSQKTHHCRPNIYLHLLFWVSYFPDLRPGHIHWVERGSKKEFALQIVANRFEFWADQEYNC